MVDLYWNVFQYLILPAGMAAGMCAVKRKYLWTSPLISSALLVLAYWMMFPDLFSNPEMFGWLLGIYLPIHLVMAVVVTVLVFWLREDRAIIGGFIPEILFGVVAVLSICVNIVGFLNGEAAAGRNIAVTAVYLLAGLALALFGGRRGRVFLTVWWVLTLVTGVMAWTGIFIDWPIPGISYLMMLLFETPFFGLRALIQQNFELLHGIVACTGLLGLLIGWACAKSEPPEDEKND